MTKAKDGREPEIIAHYAPDRERQLDALDALLRAARKENAARPRGFDPVDAIDDADEEDFAAPPQ